MSKTVKIVMFAVIGAVVLCCGGGGAGLFFVLNKATKAPKAATEEFLTALEGGNTKAAYDMLCISTRAQYEPTSFEAYVQKNAPTAHNLDWGGSYSNHNGSESASISGTVTTKNGKTKHDFALLKEDGTWKMCGNPY